jgi:two-component system sensor histidine kinase/response regulator
MNMLRSVITNLSTNAIKFTPTGGALNITCDSENGQTIIQVEDTGVGISQENLRKILDPKEHFTTHGTNNEKGTGLGLKMCHEFVKKNNGKLEVTSKVGKGTLFRIRLPNNPTA